MHKNIWILKRNKNSFITSAQNNPSGKTAIIQISSSGTTAMSRLGNSIPSGIVEHGPHQASSDGIRLQGNSCYQLEYLLKSSSQIQTPLECTTNFR
jgi:hypothetical protein